MAEVTIPKSSWLNRTDIYEFNGNLFWGHTDYPEIPDSVNDRYITVDRTLSKRIDLIAFNEYGDVNLWWVIMLANGLEYQNQIVENMVLRIPAIESVRNILTVEE